MASRGENETLQLLENLHAQLDRLIDQLEDLEKCKDDMAPEEYNEIKRETIEQFEDFQRTLKQFSTGQTSLVDELSSLQLAIQATVSNAFKTPDIIRMFAKKEVTQLRARLDQVDEHYRLGKIDGQLMIQTKVELLVALRKLGERLTSKEEQFLQTEATDELKNFQLIPYT